MLSMKIHLAVAALIAAVAFILGQLLPGFGMFFVIAAAPIWVAYAVGRSHKRLNQGERG